MKIDNIYQLENSIFDRLGSRPEGVKDPLQREALIQSNKNHERNMDTLRNIMAYNKNIINYNRILLIAILAIVIFESILLYVILIRKTHHVSGPIYVISSFMKDIIDGRKPNLRPLRDKDELKEFYELFKNMVAVIHEREQKKP